MPTGSGPTSPTLQNNFNENERKTSVDSNASNSSGGHSNGTSKLPTTMSHDHTLYVQRARVTRPAPPKPSANPMQFVQIKPCNLYQSAQEQLKRAEEVKKVKEVKKEDPEDWQCNLDNWKSSRRKRVEHIIDRVVEVKKLELEEHDRTRRKSKTFSEMMEEKKCSRRATKLAAIVYAEEETNDLSDLGIGTSSASGKSSLSEDYDNQSVMSDNAENDKHSIDLDHQSNHEGENGGTSRGYTSSPGYDTSSSTAPASSPDPCEYTYEGAIQDYKTRISKAQSSSYNNDFRTNLQSSASYSKDSTPERIISLSETTSAAFHSARRPSGTKIEDRLMSFEIKSAIDTQSENTAAAKKDLPKVDILKRRELFEKENFLTVNNTGVPLNKQGGGGGSNDFSNSKSIKERLSDLGKGTITATVPQTVVDDTKKSNRLSGDISTIKDRLQVLEKQTTPAEKTPKIDVPVVSLKDRLSSLKSAVTKEETKKPVVLIDEYQLEMMKQEQMMRQQQQQQQLLRMADDASNTDEENMHSSQEILSIQDESNVDTDREDSGIHTTDVSCSVSQTDEQPELLVGDESHHHHHINTNDGLSEQDDEDKIPPRPAVRSQDAVVANKPLSPVSQSDDTVFTETSTDDRSLSIATPEPTNELDASVNEALEIALLAIDSETSGPVSILSIHSTSEVIPPAKSTEPIYENISESVRRNASMKPQMEPPLPAPRLPQPLVPVQQPQQQKQQQQQQQQLAQLQQQKQQEKSCSDPEDDQEPYYQVPRKPSEPVYEVPKYQKPIPVYENIEIFYPSTGMTAPLSPLDGGILEPPKEKPPPPPIDDCSDEEENIDNGVRKSSGIKASLDVQMITDQPMKRMNSTKRIKKELRNKRSSFLGIEGTNYDESYLELTVAPPPDMAQLLQEEKRLEKQLYMKAGLYDSSDTGDSRDSGVSENHSRQSSEPFTNSSEEHEDLLVKKEKEIIEVLEKEEEKQRNAKNLQPQIDAIAKTHCSENQIHPEHDEVLRVERELLQLEQEEIKRQRDNLILRESLARHDLGHGAKMLMSASRRSMNDISAMTNGMSNGHYANIPNQIYQIETDYCKSMTDLHDTKQQRLPLAVPPVPPAKPMRSNIIIDSRHSSGLVKIASPTRVQHSQSIDELAPLRNCQPNLSLQPGNMSRHTLHALSAAPKPKFTDGWVQSRNGVSPDRYSNGSSWLTYQEKRRSVPEGFNCNKHWLVQEAEQRRIEQQRGIRSNGNLSNGKLSNGNLSSGWSTSSSSLSTKCAIPRNGSHDNKALPDAVIQTLTQRVQSKGIGERRRFDALQSSPLSSATSLLSVSTPQLSQLNANTTSIPDGPVDKILSVSGKKKCSHCGEELGRGAAMIIESLRLFYHIDCFKCCVCHVQLSDGLNGTDVRVRNQKLHCQNCYSSDDGIKFSCV